LSEALRSFAERSRIPRLGSTQRYQELRTSGKAVELHRSAASSLANGRGGI
jgi:hypothetical protein